MSEIIKFEHHGKEVFAQKELKGKHRDYCLCWKCGKLKPGAEDNCKIAALLYRLDILAEVTTPVFYCREFSEKTEK